MAEADRKDFFISYNQADKAWAEWIAWELEAAGYSTVLQAWDFHAGGNFVLDMQRAAELSDHTIAVLSPDYLNALYTQPEWAAAFAHDATGEKGTLIPVRVKKCELKGFPFFKASAGISPECERREARRNCLKNHCSPQMSF